MSRRKQYRARVSITKYSEGGPSIRALLKDLNAIDGVTAASAHSPYVGLTGVRVTADGIKAKRRAEAEFDRAGEGWVKLREVGSARDAYWGPLL